MKELRDSSIELPSVKITEKKSMPVVVGLTEDVRDWDVNHLKWKQELEEKEFSRRTECEKNGTIYAFSKF